MSMHKIPLSRLEEAGLKAHGLDIGTPSQLSDAFRQGIAWALSNTPESEDVERLRKELDNCYTVAEHERLVAKGQEINIAYIERLRAGIRKHWRVVCNQRARIIDLRTKLSERNEQIVLTPKITTGHCKHNNQPGGCQLHNLQCGYPACDRRAE